MAEFVAAIDQGTTSTRCMIFDHDGAEVGRHQLEHEQILPQAGWVEHNPVEIWERTASVLTSALNTTKLSASDLAALGITNQRETTLVWNRKTGRPYYNAIVWQDTRTDRIASALDRDGRGDVIRRKAGLPPATYFSGGKVQWILENVDGVRAAAEKRRRDLRHRRHLGAVEPDRRPARRRARHRRHQRQPHHADEPRDAGLGRRAAVVLRHPARRCCPRSSRRRTASPYGVTRDDGPLGGEVPIDRHPRRPAGRHGRPGVPGPRARPRTPTAPATSCCSTPARRSSARRTGC